MTSVATSSKSSIALLVAAAAIGGGVVAAVMTGVLKKEAAPSVAQAVIAPAPVAVEPTTAPVVRSVEAAPRSVEPAPKAEPKHVEQHAKPAPAHVVVATPRPVCGNCGVVKSIEEVTKKTDASGGGAVAGALVGGVAAHQMGEGRGKDLATVIGVVGGALAGNAIEKNVRKKIEYVVTLSMADGRTETFTLPSPPAYAAGDKVKVVDGNPVKE